MRIVKKRFGSFPAVHREPKHDDHRSFLHGHNFKFEITLAARELNEWGTVIDKEEHSMIIAYLRNHFNYTILLGKDDPMRTELLKQFEIIPTEMKKPRIGNVLVCEHGCSSYGLAKTIFHFLENYFHHKTDDRVLCIEVTVYEDENSSGVYNAVEY